MGCDNNIVTVLSKEEVCRIAAIGDFGGDTSRVEMQTFDEIPPLVTKEMR